MFPIFGLTQIVQESSTRISGQQLPMHWILGKTPGQEVATLQQRVMRAPQGVNVGIIVHLSWFDAAAQPPDVPPRLQAELAAPLAISHISWLIWGVVSVSVSMGTAVQVCPVKITICVFMFTALRSFCSWGSQTFETAPQMVLQLGPGRPQQSSWFLANLHHVTSFNGRCYFFATG